MTKHLVDIDDDTMGAARAELGTATLKDTVEPLADAGRLARAGISDLEVGYSARNAREWVVPAGSID